MPSNDSASSLNERRSVVEAERQVVEADRHNRYQREDGRNPGDRGRR